MKKLIFSLLLLLSTSLYSQKIKGFGTIGLYLDKQFEQSGYANLGFGLEYKLNEWIRPEVEASFFIGGLHISEEIDITTGYITSKYNRNLTAENISLSPKITIDIGNDDDKVTLFQIMPRINFTRIQTEGKYYSLNSQKSSYDLSNTEKIITFRHSIGIGIGIYAELSEKKSDALALNIYYHNIDFGNALMDLKYNKSVIHTNQVIGAGISYYFGFVKKKK